MKENCSFITKATNGEGNLKYDVDLNNQKYAMLTICPCCTSIPRLGDVITVKVYPPEPEKLTGRVAATKDNRVLVKFNKYPAHVLAESWGIVKC